MTDKKTVRFTRIVTETARVRVPANWDKHNYSDYEWLVNLVGLLPDDAWRVDNEEHFISGEED